MNDVSIFRDYENKKFSYFCSNRNSLDQNLVFSVFLKKLKQIHLPTYALMNKGKLVEVNESEATIKVEFENEGYIDLLKRNGKTEKVENALRDFYMIDFRLVILKKNK